MDVEEINDFVNVRRILQYCILTCITVANIVLFNIFFIKYSNTSKFLINWLLLHKSICDSSLVFYLLAISLQSVREFLSTLAISISGISTFAEYITLGALFICVFERYADIGRPRCYYKNNMSGLVVGVMVSGVWVLCLAVSAVMNGVIKGGDKDSEVFLFGALHCMLLPIALSLLVLVVVTKRKSKDVYEDERRKEEQMCIEVECPRRLTTEENFRYLNVLTLMVVGYVVTLIVSLVFLYLIWYGGKQPKWFWYLYLYVDSTRLSLPIIGPLLTTILFWRCYNNNNNNSTLI